MAEEAKWSAHADEEGWFVMSEDGEPIARAHPIDHVDLAEERARLIAAAPDLYAALVQAVEYARAVPMADGMREDQEPTRLIAGEYGLKIAVFDVKAARAALSRVSPSEPETDGIAKNGSYRNWYAPPAGNVWLDVEGNAPRPGMRRFHTVDEATKAADEDASALGASVIYLGAFKRKPLCEPICETCNGYGWHPADGGSYPCPDCTPDKKTAE